MMRMYEFVEIEGLFLLDAFGDNEPAELAPEQASA
jgi:hypothetical protein